MLAELMRLSRTVAGQDRTKDLHHFDVPRCLDTLVWILRLGRVGNFEQPGDAGRRARRHVLVREGAPLAAAIAQKKRFPRLLSMFARLGEQNGQLPLMLQRAATQRAPSARRAMQLATILEPLLIVTMAWW